MKILSISCGCLLMFGVFDVGTSSCIAAEPKATDRAVKDLVIVSIRPSLQTDSRVIRLIDIANITGGDGALRERLKQLDIEDSLKPGQSVTILPPQVEFRIRIAGIDMDRVSIRGSEIRVTGREAGSAREPNTAKDLGTYTAAPSSNSRASRTIDYSSISSDEGPLEREIIQAAKDCVFSKLPWPVENIECRLLQPLSADIRQNETVAGYEFSTELRTPSPPVGRAHVRVHAEGARLSPIDVNVFLEVRHFDQVVLASKAIDRGRSITASDLYTDRQDVTDLTEYCSNTDELIGTKANRPLRALMPVRINDVDIKTRNESDIIIKRRDQVKMIAKLGSLSVTTLGEAQQEGRMGEMIRLRNIESNANIQGRVTGRGEVEISF